MKGRLSKMWSLPYPGTPSQAGRGICLARKAAAFVSDFLLCGEERMRGTLGHPVRVQRKEFKYLGGKLLLEQ